MSGFSSPLAEQLVLSTGGVNSDVTQGSFAQAGLRFSSVIQQDTILNTIVKFGFDYGYLTNDDSGYNLY